MGSLRPPRKPRGSPLGGSSRKGQVPPFSVPTYASIVDACHENKWHTLLDWDPERQRWTLTIRQPIKGRKKGKIIAQGKSEAEAPRAFVDLAAAVVDSIDKGLWLNG